MNKNTFKPIPPFRGWVLENFPFIEEDFDAITDYQLYCKIVEYIKQIANSQNEVVNNMNSLNTSFTELTNYINSYFEDLDIQSEVDTKLDEMAESGQLTDIIAQYLQLAGILAFNTVDDLANAENLSNGSFTKTYGKEEYNDGYGAFYKVRGIINTDVIDGDELVALINYPTLVAEKIHDATIEKLVNDIGDISDLTTLDKTNLVSAINENTSKIADNTSDIEQNTADINKFNFTNFDTYNPSDFTSTGDVSSIIGSLYVATNSDGSIFKVYTDSLLIALNGYSQSSISIQTRIRPTSSLYIVGAGTLIDEDTSRNFVWVRGATFSVDTNGLLTISFAKDFTTGDYKFFIFNPCVYFAKDFGDTPSPTP